MKTEVIVAKVTQTAAPELGIKEKTLYYLSIGEGENAVKLNVGEKTYESVKAIIEKKK